MNNRFHLVQNRSLLTYSRCVGMREAALDGIEDLVLWHQKMTRSLLKFRRSLLVHVRLHLA